MGRKQFQVGTDSMWQTGVAKPTRRPWSIRIVAELPFPSSSVSQKFPVWWLVWSFTVLCYHLGRLLLVGHASYIWVWTRPGLTFYRTHPLCPRCCAYSVFDQTLKEVPANSHVSIAGFSGATVCPWAKNPGRVPGEGWVSCKDPCSFPTALCIFLQQTLITWC